MSAAVAAAARAWIGRDFKQGVPEQCMAFTRQVLAEAKHPVQDKVTKDAVDGLSTSFYLASSLAGRDLGQIVDKVEQLVPGSVIFFEDTYGNYPPHTITHVGIYVGAGQMVHRPTMSRPVELVSVQPGSYWAGYFRCGLVLPDALQSGPPKPAPPEPERLKVFAHSGRVSVTHRGKPVPSTRIVIDVHDGKLGLRVNGEQVDPASLSLEVVSGG